MSYIPLIFNLNLNTNQWMDTESCFSVRNCTIGLFLNIMSSSCCCCQSETVWRRKRKGKHGRRKKETGAPDLLLHIVIGSFSVWEGSIIYSHSAKETSSSFVGDDLVDWFPFLYSLYSSLLLFLVFIRSPLLSLSVPSSWHNRWAVKRVCGSSSSSSRGATSLLDSLLSWTPPTNGSLQTASSSPLVLSLHISILCSMCVCVYRDGWMATFFDLFPSYWVRKSHPDDVFFYPQLTGGIQIGNPSMAFALLLTHFIISL
jgi:hypothetical protein